MTKISINTIRTCIPSSHAVIQFCTPDPRNFACRLPLKVHSEFGFNLAAINAKVALAYAVVIHELKRSRGTPLAIHFQCMALSKEKPSYYRLFLV